MTCEFKFETFRPKGGRPLGETIGDRTNQSRSLVDNSAN